MRVNGDDDVEGDQHAHMCANNNASVSNSHPENVSNVSSIQLQGGARNVQRAETGLQPQERSGTRYQARGTDNWSFCLQMTFRRRGQLDSLGFALPNS